LHAISLVAQSKFVAFKIAANGKSDSDFSIFAYFKPNHSFFFIEISLTWTNKKFVAFIIAADGKLGPKVSIFSTVQQTDVFFGSQSHSSPSSKFVAFKIAANGKFDSNLFIFAYFKPNYSCFFIEISPTWTNKDFVAFKIAHFLYCTAN
jgi:hypothetical protein